MTIVSDKKEKSGQDRGGKREGARERGQERGMGRGATKEERGHENEKKERGVQFMKKMPTNLLTLSL